MPVTKLSPSRFYAGATYTGPEEARVESPRFSYKTQAAEVYDVVLQNNRLVFQLQGKPLEQPMPIHHEIVRRYALTLPHSPSVVPLP